MTTVTEPFGYFRATPFGWEDCSDSDEGAKALYEITPEQALEALGWFSRLEIAQDRIVELERQQAVLVEALNHAAQYIAWREFGECRGFDAAIATPAQVIEIARAALAAVKPATMLNGLTEAETTASASVAGLMGGE